MLHFDRILFWDPRGSQKDPVQQGQSVLLSGRFTGIGSFVFCEFWHRYKLITRLCAIINLSMIFKACVRYFSQFLKEYFLKYFLNISKQIL